METIEFDASLGGTEKLPYSINSLKFAASRSVEIAAMTESILRPSKTKLVFQSLPVHMRRRVMSHNCKRLPRKLRQAHLEQLKKSGLPPKQKRPSRKYRRRPANLLEEYNRRKKQNIWLETHIWHAKRFHMTERWGHRLALAPCDKAFRACYRASSAHCLMQDISYYTPFKITGSVESIKDLFQKITSTSCGLSVGAKAFTNGNREGDIHMYEVNSFPFNYIGKVNFLWEPSKKTLWLFVHPSYSKQVESTLTDLLSSVQKNKDFEVPEKKRKIENHLSNEVQMNVLPLAFNRFRLTGPNSHAILVKSLKFIADLEKIQSNEWVQKCMQSNTALFLKEKGDYWKSISSVANPSQLPPRIIIGLIVRDPRLMRPSHRTKARAEVNPIINREALSNIPPNASISPLWDTDLHEIIKNKVMTNNQFIQHVTKLNLVPGEVFEDDPKLQSVPVILIQRPGSQDSNYKKLGYGSGWDVICPSGYGIPFWLTFIMFGARSGGLRETESLAFEMGECYLPPDSEAGTQNEQRIESELRKRYFRLPPSKRVNYVKLGINSPFICPWKLLIKDWTDDNVNSFYVLRDWRLLEEIQVKTKIKNPNSLLTNMYLIYFFKDNCANLYSVNISLYKTLIHENNDAYLATITLLKQNQKTQLQNVVTHVTSTIRMIQMTPHMSKSVKLFRLLGVPKKLHTYIHNHINTYTRKTAFLHSQECIKKKKQLPPVANSHICLVAVYLHLPVGSLRRHALICLPEQKDLANVKNIYEPHHEDPNEKLRKSKRKEHVIVLKRMRRFRIKQKKKNAKENPTKTKKLKNKGEPSEYVKLMRELWLPSKINLVRHFGSRETMGYVSQGAFSFTEAHSCGVGYVTYNALKNLLQTGLNQVLVRNTSSRKYRVAKIEIIRNV